MLREFRNRVTAESNHYHNGPMLSEEEKGRQKNPFQVSKNSKTFYTKLTGRSNLLKYCSKICQLKESNKSDIDKKNRRYKFLQSP